MLIQRHDKRIIPLMLDYVFEAADVISTGLDAFCIYTLLDDNFYGEGPKVFMTNEIFEKFLMNIQNPEMHPRTRASYSEFLVYPHLTKEQKERLVKIYLKLSLPPNDYNIRSKTCWSMGKIGERRIVPMIYKMLMADGSPSWVYHNGLTGLALLDADKIDRTGMFPMPKGKQAARKVIEFFETLIVLYPEPKKETEIYHVNNYYNWGIIYRFYPAFGDRKGIRAYDCEACQRY